jgi:DNA-binding transcriptional regulator YiaG
MPTTRRTRAKRGAAGTMNGTNSSAEARKVKVSKTKAAIRRAATRQPATGFDVLALRKKLGGAKGKRVSRAAMAKLLGVSPGSIYNWEKGSNAPTSKAVAALNALSERVDRGELKVAGRAPGAREPRRGTAKTSRRASNGLEGPTYYANDVVVSRGESEGCLRFRLQLEGASVAVCNVLLPLGAFDTLRSDGS